MKNVLFISTTFNSYYKEIIKKLSDFDFNVDWYSDRPSNGIITRALIRLNKKILKRKIIRYQKKIIKETCLKKYDIIFVILGQSFDESFWCELRETQKTAKFIYYNWDSIDNFPCIAINAKYFDKIYSFDSEDCKKNGYFHLPLFYIDVFKKEKTEEKYDFCFIGTVKPGRYTSIKNMIKQLEQNGLKGYTFFYLHSKFVLLYYKIRYRKEFKNVKSQEISFKLLDKEECALIESQSHIIIDAAQPGQNGLTIRIFEALGLGKKVLTTNENIKQYDFYNPKNILLDSELSSDSIKILKSDYCTVDKKIVQDYSIESWLKKIIGDEMR